MQSHNLEHIRWLWGLTITAFIGLYHAHTQAGAKFRRKAHDQLQPELQETFSKVACVFVS